VRSDVLLTGVTFWWRGTLQYFTHKKFSGAQCAPHIGIVFGVHTTAGGGGRRLA
jgi:hypothetical protein